MKKQPNVAIYSLFRDNAGPYIDLYFQRITELTYSNIRVYAVEGDSRDNTHNQLLRDANWCWKQNVHVEVYQTTTGVERYGSVVNERRFLALAQTANVALEAIAEAKWADYILLIESDLMYEPDLIERLLAHVKTGKEVVAPSIYADDALYDVWGFRLENGDWINPLGSYSGIQRMLSVGSVTLYPAKPIYMGVRFDKMCMRGLCERFVRYDHPILWDTSIRVDHPTVKNPLH